MYCLYPKNLINLLVVPFFLAWKHEDYGIMVQVNARTLNIFSSPSLFSFPL